MKLSTTLVLTFCAGVAAFVAGHLTQRETTPEAAAPETRRPASLPRAKPSRGSRDSATAVQALGKYAACSREFSAKNAALLTSDERLELLANGALASDFGNQAAMLCGLISTLTKYEMAEAMSILGGIQDRGNHQSQEVWDSLWKQWGRVDPEGCLADFGENAVSKSPTDSRNVMLGWLEINADAALAWAQKPGKAPLEATAAALAISRNANGDLKQLESAILKLPADGLTSKACLEDYFDLASLAGKDQTAATIYQQVPAALRPAAWSVAARRIGYGDSAAAKAWVSEHAADPGRNYDGITDLFNSLTHEDPAGTARWAAQLPYSAASDRVHPAFLPVRRWLQRDPAAADAWLKTQSPDAPWVPPASR
ncbi:MAG: hypothetical protein V4819_03105 [Verrucomicrobiota bacterium]